MKIILTSPGRSGISLTGQRETLFLEGRRREYVQVSLDGPGHFGIHIGWVRVEDLARALEGGSTP